MTTTGDLFVNIKGNNQGLKRSLDQSARDIKAFGQKAEKAVGGGGNAVGNVLQAATAGAALFGTGSWDRIKANIGDRVSRRSSFLYGATHTRGKVTQKQTDILRMASHKQPSLRDAFWERNAKATDRSDPFQRMRSMDRGLKVRETAMQVLSVMASAPVAVAAVAGAVLVHSGTKWAKRLNESAMQYSGAAIGNQARIDAANMRRDIALARSGAGSSIMRQNAADYRLNSGGGAETMNMLGAAKDYAVGGLSDFTYFMARGGIMGHAFRQIFTAGGIK